MDKETIETYDQEAENIAKLHAGLTPHRIYELILLYFIKGGSSCDIGCGIGRDMYWLNKQGYPCVGVDGSAIMLEQAQSLYPGWQYIHDSLPNLKKLGQTKFDNILCSAVLMHLNRDDLKNAISNLIELLNDNGYLILSFRGTHATDHRENGKLYEPIELELLKVYFQEKFCTILLIESETEVSRNITWHNVVIRKSMILAG
jgi:2-polyprenyl-3-methyl-5-hydroxy-6-metoxy-1,4-benzoquinol methylase